jgi:hypothetical protein
MRLPDPLILVLAAVVAFAALVLIMGFVTIAFIR